MWGAFPLVRRRRRLSTYAGSDSKPDAMSLISRVDLFRAPLGRPLPAAGGLGRALTATCLLVEAVDADDEGAVAQSVDVVRQDAGELLRDGEFQRGVPFACQAEGLSGW